MTPIAFRLKEFFTHKQINVNELGLLLGYPQPEKLYRLFRKKDAKPSVDILEDISNMFEDLDINWIITGKGEMLKSSEKVNEQSLLVSINEAMNAGEIASSSEAIMLLEAAKKLYESLLDKQGKLIESQAAHINSLELMIKEKKEGKKKNKPEEG